VIDTWKLLDNLRRSLLPPALLLLLVAGWLILPGAAWVWTAVALLPCSSGVDRRNDAYRVGRAGTRWRQSCARSRRRVALVAGRGLSAFEAARCSLRSLPPWRGC